MKRAGPGQLKGTLQPQSVDPARAAHFKLSLFGGSGVWAEGMLEKYIDAL